MEHAIVLAPEVIAHLGQFPITNTILTTWIAMIILVASSLMATSRMTMVPSGIQNFFELIIEGIYNITEELAHSKEKVLTFFPFLATFFLFIVTSNWLGLLPGFATIGFKEVHDGKEVFLPLLRSANTDLNTTLSLALISVITTHFFAIRFLGILGYLQKWFSLNPIFLFVGLLELVGEFTKMVSLSFRLFGNIFAGEVVLTTIAGILAFVAPLPFYFLEIIVGVVQGAVFMMLTMVFMVLLSQKHTGEEGH